MVQSVSDLQCLSNSLDKANRHLGLILRSIVIGHHNEQTHLSRLEVTGQRSQGLWSWSWVAYPHKHH